MSLDLWARVLEASSMLAASTPSSITKSVAARTAKWNPGERRGARSYGHRHVDRFTGTPEQGRSGDGCSDGGSASQRNSPPMCSSRPTMLHSSPALSTSTVATPLTDPARTEG
jgi:hypothetical protein